MMTDDPWVFWVCAPAVYGSVAYLGLLVAAAVVPPLLWSAALVANLVRRRLPPLGGERRPACARD
jgi:hypothetical protein